MNYNGYIGDNARTIAIGSVDPKIENLLEDTQKPYSKESSVYGQAIESVIFQMLSNHLSSPNLMESFEILLDMGLVKPCMNCLKFQILAKKAQGPLLKPGMALAIEPMINLGSAKYTIFRRWMDSRNG